MRLIGRHFGSLRDAPVRGIAFKPGTDDVREVPGGSDRQTQRVGDMFDRSVKPAKSASTETSGPAIWATNVLYRRSSNRTLRHRPNAQMLCFCTNPKDVQTRHNISAFPSEVVDKATATRSRSPGPLGRLAWIFRIAFKRIPVELVHWVKSLRAVSRMDMLIVAGTGIVSDYLCGPRGWPYDIFKQSKSKKPASAAISIVEQSEF